MNVHVRMKSSESITYENVDEVSFINAQWVQPLRTTDKPITSLVLNMNEICAVWMELKPR